MKWPAPFVGRFFCRFNLNKECTWEVTLLWTSLISQMFLFAIVKIPAGTVGREQRTGVPVMSHWELVHSKFITV
jgi:hypothetical protein